MARPSDYPAIMAAPFRVRSGSGRTVSVLSGHSEPASKIRGPLSGLCSVGTPLNLNRGRHCQWHCRGGAAARVCPKLQVEAAPLFVPRRALARWLWLRDTWTELTRTVPTSGPRHTRGPQ
jgi:hypothetical protein